MQKGNMQLKLDLCVQAEALKDSTEWKKTTEEYIKLQKRWKEIGPVPKKHSEVLWKRFRTACDHFFKTKSEFFNTVDSRQDDNLKLKLELIEKVKGFEKSDDDKENLKVLMNFQIKFLVGFIRNISDFWSLVQLIYRQFIMFELRVDFLLSNLIQNSA